MENKKSQGPQAQFTDLFKSMEEGSLSYKKDAQKIMTMVGYCKQLMRVRDTVSEEELIALDREKYPEQQEVITAVKLFPVQNFSDIVCSNVSMFAFMCTKFNARDKTPHKLHQRWKRMREDSVRNFLDGCHPHAKDFIYFLEVCAKMKHGKVSHDKFPKVFAK